MQDRLVHRQIGQGRLLAGDDDVDVVATAQAVIGDRQQGVRVGRQVDPDDVGLLVDDVVDEAGVLVAEPVVVLAPDVAGEQVVERGDRAAPRDLAGHLQPLGVLVEHRVDDVDERFVAVEQAVSAGQQVALEPALAEVLGQHLHHPSVGPEMLVGGSRLGHPSAVGHLEDGVQAVRGRLVGTEQAECRRVGGDHVAEVGTEDPRRLAGRRGRDRDRHRVVAEVREAQVAQEETPVGVRVRAHPTVAAGRQGRDLRTAAHRSHRTGRRVRTIGAMPPAARGVRGSFAPGSAAPGGIATSLRPARRRPPRDRSSPWACAG